MYGLKPQVTDNMNNSVTTASIQYRSICWDLVNFGGIYSIKTNSDPFLILGKASTDIPVYNSLKNST